jgi:hypothetical protein
MNRLDEATKQFSMNTNGYAGDSGYTVLPEFVPGRAAGSDHQPVFGPQTQLPVPLQPSSQALQAAEPAKLTQPYPEFFGDEWGGLRRSPAQKQDYAQRKQIYRAAKRALLTAKAAAEVEKATFGQALVTLSTAEELLNRAHPHSRTAAVGEVLLERLSYRVVATVDAVSGQFHTDVLGR